MKVVHVSTHDITGGAARAAFRIHRGLVQVGVESSMLVAVRASSDSRVAAIEIDRRLPARVRRWGLRKRMAADRANYATSNAGFERFSDDRTELGADLIRQLPEADLIHLHSIADFLDYGEFFGRLPAEVPLVWTLHDMNPFTGGCHYDAQCGRFADTCGSCPQLGSTEDRDLSNQIWERKSEALSKIGPERMHIVADSRWLEGEARRSSLFNRFPMTTIHYGLDTDVFAPHDRGSARAAVGVSSDSLVILFVSDSLENPRKGFTHLMAALERVTERRNLTLISVGRGQVLAPSWVRHLHLERVENDEQLAALYSAADLFVIPSLQEAFGQTALEAMACGIPAIGFDTGGVREVIRGGETGRLVPRGDADALGEAISRLLQDRGERKRMSIRCRETAIAEHSLAAQGRQYLSLYSTLANAGDRQSPVSVG